LFAGTAKIWPHSERFGNLATEVKLLFGSTKVFGIFLATKTPVILISRRRSETFWSCKRKKAAQRNFLEVAGKSNSN
jgi:hypothetical protein